MTQRFRRALRHKDNDGFSLVELLVSMIVFSLAIAMIYGVLIKIEGKTTGSQQSADAVAQLRSALSDIDKQVRSGNVLYSPANESNPTSCQKVAAFKTGTCMRIFTQTDFNVAASASPNRCVQWQTLPDAASIGTYLLRTRNWDPAWTTSGDVSTWRTVAHGLVLSGIDPLTTNPWVVGDAAYGSSLPFTLNAASDFGSRLLDVKFEVKDVRDGKTATLQSSLSGRNTTYGYDANLCTPVP